MMQKTPKQYGKWRSPFALETLLAGSSPPMHPFRHRGRLHWLQAQASDGGRVVLMAADDDGKARCLTPSPFNIRTKVHEYGGRCFCIVGDAVIFNNFADGRLYRQSLTRDDAPVAFSPATGNVAFADLLALPNADDVGVVAVMESADGDGDERDFVVAVTARGVNILAQGADFYAGLAVSPAAADGTQQIAWMEWDNPFMPWDESRLMRGELVREAGGYAVRNRRTVVAQTDTAVLQPGFVDARRLLFLRDAADSDYWNFYLQDGEVMRRVTDDEFDYGEAQWQLGQRRWRAVSTQKIIAVGGGQNGDALFEIALDDARRPVLRADGFAYCADVQTAESEVLFVGGYADRDAEICALPAASEGARVVRASPPASEHGGSQPRAIRYAVRDGGAAHAYFYPPHNRNYCAPTADAKPPLVVMVHGGPTGRATPAWHPLKQYFASLGYAVLDVNHRGSSGYGRAYRQKLLGEWGVVDADDIADGVAHVVGEGWADEARVFIRGGSAGGYAVLRALTRYPKLFCGGACYYGIGNLLTLARITHRFEGYYTDRLIGEKYDAAARYDPILDADSRFISRSPVFQLARLACPLILFQGLRDKVVPPALSREVVAALKEKGIRHEYVEYAEEGHGFRRLENRVDSLRKETAFFAGVLRGE